jgi:hypothetical protein
MNTDTLLFGFREFSVESTSIEPSKLFDSRAGPLILPACALFQFRHDESGKRR